MSNEEFKGTGPMETVYKGFSGDPVKANAEKDISLINQHTLRELKPEEVFVFNVNLCDDQIDRDIEAFSVASLRKLEKLFVGKPLIQDHAWSASKQQGRIYQTQCVQDNGVNRLRASIYILRSEGTAETIRQIEAGILKEVSVSVRVKRCVCSVCGEDMTYDYMTGKRHCKNGHIVGEKANGQTIHGVLEDPVDAFEVSMVAVPAQRQAGVTKNMNGAFEPAGWKGPFSSEKEYRARKAALETIFGKMSDQRFEELLNMSPEERQLLVPPTDPKKGKQKVPGLHPGHKDNEKGVFYILPKDLDLEHGEKLDIYTAIGLARRELGLGPVSVYFFANEREVALCASYYYHPIKAAELQSFRNIPNLLGCVDYVNNDTIFCRYYPGIDVSNLQKTIGHELYHLMQNKVAFGQSLEEIEKSASEYDLGFGERLSLLSEAERDEVFYDEMQMRDYSK